jgi:hypothetical protein
MTLTISSPTLLADAGQNIDLFPVSSELTVAQAAKLLNMSVGCLDELLDDEIITSRLENGKRLIQMDSFLEFEAEYRERLKALAEMTRWDQEMGLYDD